MALRRNRLFFYAPLIFEFCWRRACPLCRDGLFLFNRSISFARERDVFLCDFSRCVYRCSLSADAGLPLAPGRPSSIWQSFFVRARVIFLRSFSRCAYRRSLSAGAGMPLRPGRALPFLTKRKEAKIRQGGSFDSLPLGTPTQRPKALPLETERSSRSAANSRTGTACAWSGCIR